MTTDTHLIEVVVALLVVLSGLFALVSAIGYVRLPDFFLRMHPPALAYTLGSWCMAVAATIYFSFLQDRAVLLPLLVPLFLAVTVPVTTLLLARVSLFRQRASAVVDDSASPQPIDENGRAGGGMTE